MTANVLIALFSALAGPALVSGNHLAAVKHDLPAMANPEPASWCFTYYSCYLAAQETPQLPYPLPGGVVTTITSIVSVPTLVPIFPTPLLTTSLSGLPSSPSPTTPGPLPTVLPGPVDIIIAIIPRVTGPFLEKRTLAKRDIGGFISDVGSPNPKDCTSATTFRLDSGQLGVTARPGFSIYADVGVSFNEFRSRELVNAGAGVVTTTFAQGFDSILSFSNASFAGGEAGFCQVAATGQVYATYVASPAQFPAGCLPVLLSALDPKLCQGSNSTTGPAPGSTSITSAAISSNLPSSSGAPQTTPGPESSGSSSATNAPPPDSSTSQSSSPESTTGPIISTSSEPSPSSSSEPGPEPEPSSRSSLSTSSTGSTESTGSTQSTSSLSTGSTESTSSLSTSSTESTSSLSTSSTQSTSSTGSTESTSSTLSTSSLSTSSLSTSSQPSTTSFSSSSFSTTSYSNSTTSGV